MLKELKNSFTIKFVYIMLFVTLGLWAFFAYYTMNELITSQKVYAKLINISGKQRMLSQKTTLMAKRSFETKDEKLIKHTQDLIKLMKKDHKFLIGHLPSTHMKDIYFSKTYDLDKKVKDYFLILDSFCKTHDKKILKDMEEYSFKLLPKLNFAVNEFEKESNALVKKLQERECFILIGTILTLILEALFVVIPTIRRIEKKEKDLKSLNNTLEQRINLAVEDVKKKDEIIIQQSKMSAMGEMLENIAHQWRQPLSVITTAASGMQIKKELNILDDKEMLKNLDSIVNSSNYLSATIDDFRNFFKKNKEVEEFVFLDIYSKSLQIVSSKLEGEDIKVIADIKDIKYKGFKNELIQVFINLLNNSKDALVSIKEKQKLIFLNIYTKNDKCIIEFKDNGGGIEEKIKTKIFDAYFTTKHNSQGTGIGLYMSYEIITKHFKGNIKVENEKYSFEDEEQFGAKFTIELPLNS